jgi:hypothetical protein
MFTFKNKEEYRTATGGCFSFLIRVVMTLYAVILLSKCFSYGEDRIKVFRTPHESSQVIKFEEMGVVPIFGLQSISDPNG